jgi:hypothetical protein
MKPEGITDRPLPPWELPGAFRRDITPHRGPLLESRRGGLRPWNATGRRGWRGRNWG